MTPIPLSVYIHIPWCLHKCPYCDFNSHPVKGTLPEARYIEALLKDLEHTLPDIWGRPIHSLFIGGGTPSLISAAGMKRLMQGLRQRLPLRPNMEITLEANPGTVEQARFTAYREAGINRLSIGIQSYADKQLQQLQRIHNAAEAHHAAAIARQSGFDNFNLDLMFGLPEQSLEAALEDLQTAIDYQPPHLSWYQLTLEPNTLFHHHPPQLPTHDSLAQMQDAGLELLQAHGYTQYEVSAYARPRKQCQHNRNYWEFGDYIGIGAGAHGKITTGERIVRTLKYKHPETYMSACLDAGKATPLASRQELDSADKCFEFMLNALRLKDGIPKALFQQRTFLPPAKLARGIQQAKARQLLDETATHWKASEQGWRFLNETVACFL